MRAMKDSGIEWIGEIPQEWETKQVKFTLENHSGGLWGANKGESEHDCICVRVADFDYPHLSVDYSDKMTIRSYTQKVIDDSGLKKGDILLEKSGGGETTPVGRSVLFSSDSEMMCANFVEWLRPNISVQSQFLNYWLSASYINGYSKRNIKQTTGIQNLDIPAFLSEKTVIPSIEEQRQISEYLNAKSAEIETLIAAKEKTNALLKEQRQSIIYEAVTKGLDPTAPMKDSGIEWIGMIPEGWNTWRMKHLALEHLQYGANATGVEYSPELPRYIRITDITQERKLNDEGKQSLPEEIACDYMLEPGDILFARSGATSGKSFFFDESCGRCCFAGYLIRFRPDSSKANSKFLYYYTLTQAYEQWTQQIFIQATIQNISAEKYDNLVFAIPSTIDEQMKIVSYLDFECGRLDKIIQNNDATIQKLKEYRQSLIYEAVTGKIEIG